MATKECPNPFLEICCYFSSCFSSWNIFMPDFSVLLGGTSHAVIGDAAMGGKPTGLWLEELTTPYYVFKDAGFRVTVASIQGGAIPIDPRSTESDAPSVQRFLKDHEAQTEIARTSAFHTVNPLDFDALFLPGGHGTMWDFPTSEALSRAVVSMLNANKIVSAVCHGPAGLVNARFDNGDPVVKGKRVAAFTNSEERAVGLTESVPFLLETRLRELGATFEHVADFAPFSVQDGHLITGQNPASSQAVANLVVKSLSHRISVG
jgi:putative intracellular protease/amidase